MKNALIRALNAEIDPERAEVMAKYFGIVPGGYGEGDILLGIPVPTVRKICREYDALPRKALAELLHSPVHEQRFAALVILTKQYQKNPDQSLKVMLENFDGINNWDLVDVFVPKILGQWCLKRRDERILREMGRSDNLWRKRASVVAYLAFYRKGVLGEGLERINTLIEDPEPLLQKACGWMLREIYIRVDKHLVETYLRKNYGRLARMTLRYAIERMPKVRHEQYLKGAWDVA